MTDNLSQVSYTAQAAAETLWLRVTWAQEQPSFGDIERETIRHASEALHGARLMARTDSDDEFWLRYLSETAYYLGRQT